MEIINFENVSKTYTYGNFVTEALKNVNFKAGAGEMIAIMGPSGSGKSTMLNILGCIDRQSSGNYLLDGNKVSDLDKNAIAKIRNEKIGFIFQQFVLIQEYTVYENLELPLLIRNNYKKLSERYNKATRFELVQNKLDEVDMDLEEYLNKTPGELSGGQQQRVAIARALITNPDIILADEPTGALDQKTGKDIMNLLSEINKTGKLIIIITHDPNVAAYCNRVLHVIDGELSEKL